MSTNQLLAKESGSHEKVQNLPMSYLASGLKSRIPWNYASCNLLVDLVY